MAGRLVSAATVAGASAKPVFFRCGSLTGPSDQFTVSSSSASRQQKHPQSQFLEVQLCSGESRPSCSACSSTLFWSRENASAAMDRKRTSKVNKLVSLHPRPEGHTCRTFNSTLRSEATQPFMSFKKVAKTLMQLQGEDRHAHLSWLTTTALKYAYARLLSLSVEKNCHSTIQLRMLSDEVNQLPSSMPRDADVSTGSTQGSTAATDPLHYVQETLQEDIAGIPAAVTRRMDSVAAHAAVHSCSHTPSMFDSHSVGTALAAAVTFLALSFPSHASVMMEAVSKAADVGTTAVGMMPGQVVTDVSASMPQSWGEFQSGFLSAFLLIFFSEIGDKTFFIAVLLATRNSKSIVFAGALGALVVMTILSVVIGRFFHVLDEAVPVSLGNIDLPVDDVLAVIMLVYFGVSTLRDAWNMEESKSDEEQKEAELAVAGIDGQQVAVLAATFTLVFVAEWGDRSFFSTIALAAASSPVGVIAGASAGHSIATLIAVLGGSFLSGIVSEKVIAYTGGSLFIFFALLTIAEILQRVA